MIGDKVMWKRDGRTKVIVLDVSRGHLSPFLSKNDRDKPEREGKSHNLLFSKTSEKD